MWHRDVPGSLSIDSLWIAFGRFIWMISSPYLCIIFSLLHHHDGFFFFFGHFQMIEVDIPQSLFEEQGRQLYGAQLLQIQVGSYKITVSLRRTNLPAIANLQ